MNRLLDEFDRGFHMLTAHFTEIQHPGRKCNRESAYKQR